MVSIAFVGAGSVVFTRQLVADILRYPELADARLVLHDIDPERLRVAEGTARQVSRQLGASATVEAYGEDQSFISRVERRQRRIDAWEFVLFCRVLKLEPGEVLKAAEARAWALPA